MKESNIEKEIQVVENIIRLLKDCMAISLKHKQKEECKRIIVDIKMCEKELTRLIGIRAAKDAAIEGAKEAAKEPAKGNAAV